MLLLGWHCSVSQVVFAVAAMQTPSGIFAAAGMLAPMMLDAGRCDVFRPWKPDFVTNCAVHMVTPNAACLQ
ncbi:hypothetical protein ACFX5Q_22235 [Mesorhizobium sp. IMUNJ 23033]|uniref:hypothetical protein n=1 Tax=Mesorhizobium sp. IMUNJ 23033 TaxID=3378039 RepID=UPI00384D2316